jgi:NAD-dependent deacetylase
LWDRDLERAIRAAGACDLFVAAGTSLVVGPINQMFPIARGRDAATAILTTSDTPYDDHTDWKISEPVETVLPMLADALARTH